MSVNSASAMTISSNGVDSSTNVNMNGFKITNLGNATAGGDVMNRTTSDGRYYLNTTTLNSITAPTGSISLNS